MASIEMHICAPGIAKCQGKSIGNRRILPARMAILSRSWSLGGSDPMSDTET